VLALRPVFVVVGGVAVTVVALGARVRRARQVRELSVREFARVAGISASHVQRLERGAVARPEPATLKKVATAAGLTPAELMRLAGYL